MKRNLVLAFVVVLAGCSRNSVTAPTSTPAPAASSTVSVLSEKTGQTTLVPLAATHNEFGPGFWTDISNIDVPQPPSCAWRNLVIKTHIDLGGARNDVVTLANLHRVFIQDVGSGAGYRLIDYPGPWCVGPNVMLAGQTL